jgi:tetratricopeptide (TPR) repeat protein
MRVLAFAVAVALTAAAPLAAQVTDQISRRQALERFRAGQEFLTAERYEQAVAEFTAAIGLDPMLALAHYGLGQANMGLKRYASAVLAFTGAKETYGRLATLRQSDALAVQRMLDDEMRELRDSLARVRSGQIKDAGPALEQQLEKRLEELEVMRKGREGGAFQTPAEVSLALGSAYFRNGQRPDAEREWLAAVQANPRLGEAHNNLAVIYLQTGRKKEAEEAVKAAERARFRVPPQLKADIQKMPAR